MKKRIIISFLSGIGIAVLVCASLVLIRKLTSSQDDNEDRPVVVIEPEQAYSDPSVVDVETASEYKEINFQPIVDDWAASTSGNRSILIYDLDIGTVVGSYNPDETYNTASLYKLFVVYEGYRRLQSGAWSAGDYAGSTGYTILDCLDLAIRESYSPCAETLWAMIGHEELDQIIINDFGITNSNISGLASNANDIMKMMHYIYEHPGVDDETLLARMWDSFLVQPPTTYNWRQGLPSGFSRANVYNKVGWDYNPAGYWNVYHDAAIVEFPEVSRHFVVVVMTNFVAFQRITEFGTMIENSFYAQYAN